MMTIQQIFRIIHVDFYIIIIIQLMHYICSCLPIQKGKIIFRKGIDKIRGLLTNNKLDQPIIEQQKFTEQSEDIKYTVYDLNKNRTYKIVNHDEQGQDHISNQLDSRFRQSIEDQSLTKNERFKKMARFHMGVLKKHLIFQPQEEGFEKLYSSQDTSNLKIFYKQLLNCESKRINVFRYSYNLNLTLKEYLETYSQQLLTKIEENIKSFEIIQKISQDLKICYSQYKKVLIVSPRDFVYLHYKQLNLQAKEYFVIGTSVQNQKKNLNEDVTRGHITLAGTSVIEKQNIVQVQTYLEVDLNLNINPLMMKQPTIRQIKKYVQCILEYNKIVKENDGAL